MRAFLTGSLLGAGGWLEELCLKRGVIGNLGRVGGSLVWVLRPPTPLPPTPLRVPMMGGRFMYEGLACRIGGLYHENTAFWVRTKEYLEFRAWSFRAVV